MKKFLLLLLCFSCNTKKYVPCDGLRRENIILRSELKKVSEYLEYTVRENQKSILNYKQRLREGQ